MERQSFYWDGAKKFHQFYSNVRGSVFHSVSNNHADSTVTHKSYNPGA